MNYRFWLLILTFTALCSSVRAEKYNQSDEITDEVTVSDDFRLHLAPTSTTALNGTWENINNGTGGLVKVQIINWLGNVYVKGYGACSPTPCDWGWVKASTFSPSVSNPNASALTATFNPGFKSTLLTARTVGSYLYVNTFSTFNDGSSRYDHIGTATMKKP